MKPLSIFCGTGGPTSESDECLANENSAFFSSGRPEAQLLWCNVEASTEVPMPDPTWIRHSWTSESYECLTSENSAFSSGQVYGYLLGGDFVEGGKRAIQDLVASSSGSESKLYYSP